MERHLGGRNDASILPLHGGPRRDHEGLGREGPLASLATCPMAGRFCAWRGMSERRYVASVYPVDPSADDLGLPDFSGFVLISVVRGPMGRRIVAVTSIERTSERHAALAVGLARGAAEWHVHFLAEDRSSRHALVSDLRARHDGEAIIARCA